MISFLVGKMMKKIIIILLIILELHSESNFRTGEYFDTEIAVDVLEQTLSSVSSDLYNIGTVPFTHPEQSLKALGVIGLLVAVDKETTKFYQQSIEEPLDFYKLPTLSIYDSDYTQGTDSWLVFGSLAHYLGGFALGDEKSQVTSLMAMKAIGYSYGISHLFLKSIIGRNRPKTNLKKCDETKNDMGCDPYDFGHLHAPIFETFQAETAMPSFHLTMYFSVAKVYSEMYDNQWIPYSLLALIFGSNIKGHNHWVSDMVAGAIVGNFIGGQITSNYETLNQKSKEGFSVVPSSNGLALSYRY
jgi:membrane-associated phospholipid phosphatase